MENLEKGHDNFRDVPGEISYMPQRSREDNRASGKKVMETTHRGEKAKSSEITQKAKAALLGVAIAAGVAVGMLTSCDGEDIKTMPEENYQEMMERSGYSDLRVDYGEDLSRVDFSFNGTRYFLEDEDSNGSFERGEAVAKGGEETAEYAFDDYGLNINGAVMELNARLNR